LDVLLFIPIIREVLEGLIIKYQAKRWSRITKTGS